MTDTKHVVLIHGAWARGDSWGPARTAFEERGYTVHTPTLRHHELPMHEGGAKIAPLSMRDYTEDVVALVDSLDFPPLLVGLSMGGLQAQLVAARTRHAGGHRRLPRACGRHRRRHSRDAAQSRKYLGEALSAAPPVGQPCVSPDVATLSAVDRQRPD
jgi:pimeloyl-ACP methyl ester carboxylesterase